MTKPVARSRILETMSTALLRSTRAAEPRGEPHDACTLLSG